MRREKKTVTLAHVFIAAAIIFGGTAFIVAKMPDSETGSQVRNEVSGTLSDYRGQTYQYQGVLKDGATVVTFQPFLPRDDGVLVTALVELIGKTYGSNTEIDPSPQIVARDGVNLIALRGKRVTYYATPIKEDTGEINSLKYWAE